MAELGVQNQQVLAVKEQLESFKAAQFGQSSERRASGQLPLEEEKAEKSQKASSRGKKKVRTEFGRTEQLGLFNQEICHSFDQQSVDRFGLRVWKNQFETSKLVHLIPTKLILQTHLRRYSRL